MTATQCYKCTAKYGDKIPKLLPCWHTTCLQCTKQLVENSKLNCPECRTENKVPAGGFPTNRYLIENLDHANITERKSQCTVRSREEKKRDIVPDHEVNMSDILKEVQASIHYRLEIEEAIIHRYGPSGTKAQNVMDEMMLNPRFVRETRAAPQANRRGPQDAMDEIAQRVRDAESGNEKHRYCCCCFCCCSSENNVDQYQR